MNRSLIRIASRGSELARWQSDHVRSALQAADPALDVEIEIIRTTGDIILDVPLSKIGDRGLFTKEIDEALLDGRADLAVHSMKDVPTTLPDGLVIAVITERADPRDVVLMGGKAAQSLADLPSGSRVGTSSLRRRAQLRSQYPELQILDLRGNLNTRLRRLDEGEYEAIILAAAGVERLGWADRVAQYLDPPGWLPAVGQGALAIITREDDTDVRRRLEGVLNHPSDAAAIRAERSFLFSLEGGCQVPIAALAQADGSSIHMHGLVSDLDGRTVLRAQLDGPVDEPEALGRAVARELISQGANEVLEAVREASSPPPEGP